MKIPRKDFFSSINGEIKSLRIAEPTRGNGEKLLLRIIPPRIPGWIVEVRSSHTREKTFEHLFLKWVLEEINLNEKIVLQIISSSEEEYFLISKEIFRSPEKIIRLLLLRMLEEADFLPKWKDPKRAYKGCRPSLDLIRYWKNKPNFPPKRFIGVGYKDQGRISSVPSWKEQQIPDGDINPRITRLRSLLRTFRSRTLSYRRSPTRSR